MKKFFKALALVLALALVIGVVPAQATSAKIKAKKTLYVDGAKGTSTDGKLTSSYKSRVAIYKLAGDKKSVAADHTYKAVIKSGDSVTKTKKYVYATDLGKSVVEIFKDGESLGTSVITVKKNATDATLTLTGFEDGQEVVCGVKTTVTLPRKGVDSDERRLYVDDKLQTEVEGQARVYEVTFKKAGDHKIKFEAFQSAELDKATATKEITVKAVMPKPVSAKQVSANSFSVEFEGDMTDLITDKDITNQMIYYMIAKEPVVTGVIKSVKVEGKVVTVTMFADFKQDEDYYFAYGSTDAIKFHTAKNGSKFVKTIEISLATTYIGQGNDITVKYFNADGVEINPDTGAAPTFTSSDNAAAYIDGAAKVYFCTKDTVTITGTFYTGVYDPETYVPEVATATITVAGIEKTAAAVASKAYTYVGAVSDGVTSLRMGLDGSLKVKYTLTDKTTFGNDGTATENFNIDGTTFKLQSTDETVAMITGVNTITPVSEGKTTIVLYVFQNGTWNVYDAFALTVLGQNHGATAAVTLADNKTTYNFGVADTMPAVSVKVKDLDGKDYTGDVKVTIEQVDYNAAASGVSFAKKESTASATTFKNTPVSLDLVNNSLAAKNAASVAFKVTVYDVVSKANIYQGTLTVGVGNYANDVAGVNYTYVLSSDASELDTSIKRYDSNPAKTATIKLTKVVSTSYGQLFIANDGWTTAYSKASDLPTTATSGASLNYIVYSFPSNYVASAAAVNANTVTVTNFVDNGVRATAGTYTVTAYRATFDAAGKRSGIANLGSVSVLVKKNDVAPTFAIKTSGAQGKADFLNSNKTTPKNVFLVTWDGKNSDADSTIVVLKSLDDIAGRYTYDSSTQSYYVKTLGYTVNVNGFEFSDSLTINTLFKD